MPAAGEVIRTEVKVCTDCGYHHPRQVGLDVCGSCGAPLGGVEVHAATAAGHHPPAARISADEEERNRVGYELRTTYRFPPRPGPNGATPADSTHRAPPRQGEPLADITYGDAAEIRVVNLGRRGRANKDVLGFNLDLIKGRWLPDHDDAPATPMRRLRGRTGRREDQGPGAALRGGPPKHRRSCAGPTPRRRNGGHLAVRPRTWHRDDVPTGGLRAVLGAAPRRRQPRTGALRRGRRGRRRRPAPTAQPNQTPWPGPHARPLRIMHVDPETGAEKPRTAACAAATDACSPTATRAITRLIDRPPGRAARPCHWELHRQTPPPRLRPGSSPPKRPTVTARWRSGPEYRLGTTRPRRGTGETADERWVCRTPMPGPWLDGIPRGSRLPPPPRGGGDRIARPGA